ncbi:MAG: DNA translocase FtsK [Clostridia bacterium]|nr:DNA translocase FtsK [Clostridia bacterium]
MSNSKNQSVYEERTERGSAPGKIIAAVVCFGLALLTGYLSLVAPTAGTAMGKIRDVILGFGGSVSVLIALFLAWIGVLLVFSVAGKRIRIVTTITNVLLFLCAFAAVQLFSAQAVFARMSITSFANFVSKSYQHGGGGGAIGALLAYPLYTYLGEWGGLIALVLVSVLCLVVNGRAQRCYRWLRQRSEEGQHYVEQRRNEKNVERMFEYDEFDQPAPRRTPPPERRSPRPQPENRAQSNRPRPERPPQERVQTRPTRKVSDPERDYIVIDENQPQPEAPKPKRSAPKRKLYKETIDPEAAPANPIEEQPSDIEIPKPLRKLRQNASKPQPERASESPVEDIPDTDVPDFFTVKQEEKEPEGFKPCSSASTKVKPKRVVEGVQPLTVEDIVPEPEPEEDDEAPFDVPHTTVKPTKFRRVPVPEPEDEEEIYDYPPIDLLEQGDQQKVTQAHKEADMEKADMLIETLNSFGIDTRLVGIAHGPAVTRFELQPAPGVKVSRITSLSDDIALNLAAMSVRIEAPIPGKAAVGVEIPNDKVEMVRLRDVLECPEAKRHPSKIAVGLGKDNSGRYIVADIAKMPHVLIAGQTGSGKSVCINSIITSILYRATPEEVRMILIDPKVVELSIYNDIPHLIAPVVTDPKKAASALDWAVAEMGMRYKKFAERDVRDIKGYNKKLQPGEKIMPQMVIVIDELADLMMVCPGEVEDSICRLAQLARAAGMHLVIATQRPSVNVITGIIKANIPTRIAFSVASQVDSRTMIDHGGAEKLLGNGDMLFVPSGINKPLRVQGAWVSDEEVHAVVSYIKDRSETTYDEDVVEKIENSVRSDAEREEVADEYDPRLPEAVEIVVDMGQASTSMLQRRMRVGYARAGRLIDEMEKRGIISEADGSKPRNVLITREEFLAMFEDEE